MNYNQIPINNVIPVNSEIVNSSNFIPIQYSYQYQPDPVQPPLSPIIYPINAENVQQQPNNNQSDKNLTPDDMQLQQVIVNNNNDQHVQLLNYFIPKYEKLKQLNFSVSRYYDILYNLYFVSITMWTMIISILSFVDSSGVANEDASKWISFTVGIIGIFVTLLHNLHNGFKIQVKRDQFKQSGDDYDDLIEEMKFKKYTNGETIEHILKDIEVTVGKIKNRNKFVPPKFIVNKYK